MIEKSVPSEMQMNQGEDKEEYFQLKKASLTAKSMPKKVTCVHVYEDILYLGTRQSKIGVGPRTAIWNSHLQICQQVHSVQTCLLKGLELIEEKVLIPHCEIVTSIASNQKYFVTVAESDDEMPVSVWDANNRMFITALKGHQSQVSKALFLGEPGWLVTSCWDCKVKIWDLRNIFDWEENVKTIQSEYPVLTVAQLSADVIAFGGDDCYLNFWNWRTMQFLGKYFGHAGSVTLIYSQSSFILTAGGDHRLKEWQVNLMSGSAAKNTELDHSKENIENEDSKSIARVSREVKRNYDSSIFLAKIGSKDILLLDRHGNRLLHRFGRQFVSCANNFKYNENITGMVHHNGHIYVATTKGELLCFKLEMIKNPYQQL